MKSLPETPPFHIIDRTLSTNNDAIEMCRSGNGIHGTAIFARHQLEGRGQRGKNWQSSPDENILMSVLLQNPIKFQQQPFVLSMLIALTCRAFLSEYLTNEVKIKWPNDLIIADRKAGGILIDNIYRGQQWGWSVVGIGININQITFSDELTHATSLFKITEKQFPVISMAADLHQSIIKAFNEFDENSYPVIIDQYNAHLYKLNREAKFQKHNQIIVTNIQGVNKEGMLLTTYPELGKIRHGEADWIWD